MIMKEKSIYSIQIVDYALDILEQIDQNQDEFNFTDLCNRLNLQKNRVFRLLATLEFHNFIEQNAATSAYRLGLKNLHLRQSFFRHNGLLRHSQPILDTLTLKSQETSYLAIVKDYQVVYLDARESSLPVRAVPRNGRRHPFYCTAAGKVIAAAMNDKILGEYLENRELVMFTPRTIVDPEALTEHLHLVAAAGYAVEEEELEIGVSCLAAPIRDYTKRVVGAISLSAPTDRCSRERVNGELLPLVKAAAEEFSAKLGYG